MNGETSREEKTPDPSSSTPASPPTEQPALSHLLEVAAKIVRREYLPTLESCKNIGQARSLIARYEATHSALGMELKSIFDKLASVRAASQQETQWLDTDLWNHADALLNDIEGGGADLAEIKKSIYQSMRSAIIDYSKVRAASTGTGSRIEELESAYALLRAQIERADKVLNKPAPPVASQKGKEEE